MTPAITIRPHRGGPCGDCVDTYRDAAGRGCVLVGEVEVECGRENARWWEARAVITSRVVRVLGEQGRLVQTYSGSVYRIDVPHPIDWPADAGIEVTP